MTSLKLNTNYNDIKPQSFAKTTFHMRILKISYTENLVKKKVIAKIPI
jgi:hypothetical protein